MQDPATMVPSWPDAHAAAAAAEGWSIFSTSGPACWQIQHFDSVDEGQQQLDSDEAAWTIVRSGTGAHHISALAFIKAHCPAEYATVMAGGPAARPHQ